MFVPRLDDMLRLFFYAFHSRIGLERRAILVKLTLKLLY